MTNHGQEAQTGFDAYLCSVRTSVIQLSGTNEKNPIWGCSSAGRAPALQAGGQGFDSLHLHQPTVSAAKARERIHRGMLIRDY